MESEKTFLIDEIVAREWDMFSAVSNIGGRAPCQDEDETFQIMRRCNLMTWPVPLLASYRADLEGAEQSGRNLMTEKYARMMEATVPDEYAAIARFLPPVAPEAASLVERAAAVLLAWEEELRERYPFIAERGRGLGEDAGPGAKTSFATYLKAELTTYSVETLRLYGDHLAACLAASENGSRAVYENMMRLYGYEDLDAAARALAEG